MLFQDKNGQILSVFGRVMHPLKILLLVALGMKYIMEAIIVIILKLKTLRRRGIFIFTHSTKMTSIYIITIHFFKQAALLHRNLNPLS